MTLKPALATSHQAFYRAALCLLLALLWAAPARAGDTAAEGSQAPLQGLYRVGSSTDPAFPLEGGQEWFLAFGRGGGKSSGSLALTLRQNPNLRVRLLVWQFFPDSATLRIGRQSARSSQQAVLATDWQLAASAAGSLLLRRGGFQLMLVPATLSD
jgi:hypothetical protein